MTIVRSVMWGPLSTQTYTGRGMCGANEELFHRAMRGRSPDSVGYTGNGTVKTSHCDSGTCTHPPLEWRCCRRSPYRRGQPPRDGLDPAAASVAAGGAARPGGCKGPSPPIATSTRDHGVGEVVRLGQSMQNRRGRSSASASKAGRQQDYTERRRRLQRRSTTSHRCS